MSIDKGTEVVGGSVGCLGRGGRWRRISQMGPDASGERVYSGAASGSRSEGRRSAAIADQPVRWGFGRQASTGPASHRSGQLEQLALAEASAPAGGAGATPS